jgi:hypothetical protein
MPAAKPAINPAHNSAINGISQTPCEAAKSQPPYWVRPLLRDGACHRAVDSQAAQAIGYLQQENVTTAILVTILLRKRFLIEIAPGRSAVR